MQSRAGSMIEAVANVAVGYGIAVAANIVVLPLFGFHPSLAQHAQIGLIFTCISLVRSYCLRRLFNWWGGRGSR